MPPSAQETAQHVAQHPWSWRFTHHPLTLPLGILGGVSAVVINVTPSNWLTIHVSIFAVGVALLLGIYLVLDRGISRLLLSGRSIDNLEGALTARVVKVERGLDEINTLPEIIAMKAKAQAEAEAVKRHG